MSSPDSPSLAAFVQKVFGDDAELAAHVSKCMVDAKAAKLRGDPQPAPFVISHGNGNNGKTVL